MSKILYSVYFFLLLMEEWRPRGVGECGYMWGGCGGDLTLGPVAGLFKPV